MVLISRIEPPEAYIKVLYNKYLFFQIIFPLIGGFLYGYNTGIVAGALYIIKANETITSYQVVVAATPVAAALSSILGGVLADRFGRKPTLICSCIFLICGNIIMALIDNIIALIGGRFVVGLGIGLAGTSCLIYIAEVAPYEIRGRLVVLYQASIAGGQFISALLSASVFNVLQPRYILLLAVIPAFIQGLGLIFIPESHRWLLSNDKIHKAKVVIKKEKRIDENFIDEYVDSILLFNKEAQDKMRDENIGHRNIIYKIFHDRTARQSLFIGCLLEFIQQMVGVNGVVYYSTSILNMAGVEQNISVLWYSVLVMFFCFAPVLISYLLIDRIGRRKLLLGSLVGIILSTVVLAVGFQIMNYLSAKVKIQVEYRNNYGCFNRGTCEECVTLHTCGFCSFDNATYCLPVNMNDNTKSEDGPCSSDERKSSNATFNVRYCNSSYTPIIIVGMSLYLLSFAVGVGPVPWVVASEIFPTWCRGINMSIALTVNWACNVLVSMTFLTMTEEITRYGTFWLFGGISLCSLVLVYKLIPETNQRALEEMEPLLAVENIDSVE